MNVALVGFGVENQAVYRYFQSKGITPVICDQNPDTPLPGNTTGQLGETYLDNLGSYDVIVRSVGIHPKVILEKNPGVESKITTAVNLFFEENKTPVIGVTGTKGKGTTSTLIFQILKAAGKKVVLAGNIGTPMLDVLNEAQTCDFVALELSSFQLYDCRYSPTIAVCLMVVPEHMNWHADMVDYKHAKGNMFRYQNSDDVAVYNALCDESKEIASASPAIKKLTYSVPLEGEDVPPVYTVHIKDDTVFYHDQALFKTSEVALLGRHNLENICAAIAATWDIIGGDTTAIRSVISSFTGLEHRLELIRELDGVQYYDDSFGTTPETASVAIDALKKPKVLILGGSVKESKFDDLAQKIADSDVRQIILIGNTSNPEHKCATPDIQVALESKGVGNITSLVRPGGTTIEEIVQTARNAAQPGDAVLLSTGCASFDMFKDYKDRGKQFTQAVQALV